MILADKILNLRKKNGWSQEELADKLNVSRQSVSKWESAASIPDINKILEISRLFGVSTDYLLKDEQEQEQPSEGADEQAGPMVTLGAASEYMEYMRRSGRVIGTGVAMCILSPVTLILLSGLSADGTGALTISSGTAAGIGLAVLLIMVAAAVALFIYEDMRGKPFEYLSRGEFQLEYGVSGIVREKKSAYLKKYTACTAAGVAVCILSVLPLIIAGCAEQPDETILKCIGILLVLVAGAVWLFVATGTVKESYDRLLCEEEYEPCSRKNTLADRLLGFYWPLVTAIYLGWSFFSRRWDITWVIWPIAGLLSAGISALVGENEK